MEQPAVAEAARPPGLASSPSKPGRRTLAQHLAAEDETAVYAILMPQGYQMKEGAELWRGVRLGKLLGAGAQAKVFQLADDQGRPTGKVLKVNHSDLGSKMLNNNVLWVGIDRDWLTGTELRAALQHPDGSVPGFMKVCDCVVSSAGNGRPARLSGMIMGELHGWEVYKRINTPEFHNIHYVREMLFQVFSALDRAQCKLGFHHADLGMRNVMEHYPRLWADLPAAEAEKAQATLRRPGFTMNADGSRLPLGPDVEFKIIDFGLAKFSTKVAAAAGGRAAQEVVEELHERFGKHEPIIFGSEDSPTSIEFQPVDLTERSSHLLKLRSWLKLPCKTSRCVIRLGCKLGTKRICSGVGDAGGEQADAADLEEGQLHAADDDEEDHGQEGRQAGDASPGGGDFLSADEWLPTRLPSLGESAFSRASAAATESRKCLESRRKRRKKKKSPVETIYRHWWHRKGDVFHLLLTLGLVLDDRCWPEEDEDEVQALCSLVHHATGVKMRASFKEAPDGAAAAADAGAAPGSALPFGRRKWQHWFRRWQIRLKAHILPYNSGLLAREALSHPFFGAGAVCHATVPVAVRAAFP